MSESCQGSPPPTPLSIVDLWLLATETADPADLAHLSTYLEPAEQHRLQTLTRPQARQQLILSRGCLRVLLGHYTGKTPAALRFAYGPQGKPALDFAAEDGFAPRFNLSHSGERILIAVSVAEGVGAIGVDIEKVRSVRHLPALCHRYFTHAEAKTILAPSGHGADYRFLRYWTGKEACLKAMGTGIAESLQKLELTLPSQTPGVDLTPITVSAPDLPQHPRQLYQWQPEPGYLAAVAMQAPTPTKACFRLHQTTPQALVTGAAFSSRWG